MQGFPDSPFWDFSLEVYGRSGVAAACLSLQDRRKLDVNVLLLCCWLGAEGYGAVDRAIIQAAVQSSRSWNREVVTALRKVRRSMKGGFPPAPNPLVAALRDRVIAIEHDCEHVEQIILGESVPAEPESPSPPESRAADAAANLRTYFRVCRTRVRDEDSDDLTTILAGCFPETNPKALAGLIGPAS